MINYLNEDLNYIISDIENKYGKDIIYITDDNVYKYYFNNFKERIIVFKHGEDYKTLETVNNIYSKLLEFNANKGTVIVGVGGGIVSDVTGYVASTFMRGVKFGFISTTLLGMVDASIGGKNGVNFNNYKNLIGNIKEPNFIYISPYFLKTLPQREVHAAFGEILKYAIGFDKDLFEHLEKDDISYEDIIYICSNIKVNVVSKDLYENSGERKKLNLGHTIAHAVEKYTHKYVHGECVLMGLYLINIISYLNNLISENDYLRVKKLLENYNFIDLDKDTFLKLLNNSIEFIKFDKKGIDTNKLDIVLIDKIGNSKLISITQNDLKNEIQQAISLI